MIRRFAPLAVLTLLSSPALAAGPDYLVLGAGATDVLSSNAKTAGEFRFEYRSGLSLLPFYEQYVQVKPWVGGQLTTRGAAWGGGGILLDIPIGSFVVSPSFGVGAYGQGHGKKLGSVVEFRSQIEAGYMFADGTRITAAFDHISNAGLTRHNPGTEEVTINYQLPIGNLFGR